MENIFVPILREIPPPERKQIIDELIEAIQVILTEQNQTVSPGVEAPPPFSGGRLSRLN